MISLKWALERRSRRTDSGRLVGVNDPPTTPSSNKRSPHCEMNWRVASRTRPTHLEFIGSPTKQLGLTRLHQDLRVARSRGGSARQLSYRYVNGENPDSRRRRSFINHLIRCPRDKRAVQSCRKCSSGRGLEAESGECVQRSDHSPLHSSNFPRHSLCSAGSILIVFCSSSREVEEGISIL